MTELPNELRELLDLARDAHDPTDPDARQRVRQAVAASLLLGGASTSGSLFPQGEALASNTQTLAGAAPGKAGWALLGSKATTLVVGAVAAAGLTLAAYSFARQPTAVRPTVQPSQQVAPAPAPEPVVAPAEPHDLAPTSVPEAESAHAVDKPVRAKKAQPSAESLAAETRLLRTASEALSRGDELSALTELREHGRRFPNGSLREERDGLRAIAECSRDDATNKQATAKKFLRSYPSSLLGARVSKACAGE